MREFFSFALLALLVVPSAIGLLIMLRNELEIKEKTTGGYGILPLAGFMLIFIVMPVFAFFVRF